MKTSINILAKLMSIHVEFENDEIFIFALDGTVLAYLDSKTGSIEIFSSRFLLKEKVEEIKMVIDYYKGTGLRPVPLIL